MQQQRFNLNCIMLDFTKIKYIYTVFKYTVYRHKNCPSYAHEAEDLLFCRKNTRGKSILASSPVLDSIFPIR